MKPIAWALGTRLLGTFARMPAKPLLDLPTLVSMTASYGNVVVARVGVPPDCWLKVDQITFDAIVDVPGTLGGILEFVQNVIVNRTREGKSGHQCWRTQGPPPTGPKSVLAKLLARGIGYELDTVDPLKAVPVGVGHQSASVSDAPGNSLADQELVKCDDQFRMFLMWRPNRFKGQVRVPVAMLEWWWKGEAWRCGPNDPPDCPTQPAPGQPAWYRKSGDCSAGNGASTTLSPEIRLKALPNWVVC